jgi:UPF0755 protein
VKYFFAALLLFIIVALSLGFWYGYQVYFNPRPAKMLVLFSITPKESASSIISRLKSENLIRSEIALKVYLRLNNLAQKLKPGGYQISRGFTPERIIDQLIKGPEDVWVTIPEGWRREQIAARLKNSLKNFDPYEFNTVSAPFEGQLFPDTYLIPAGATASDTLQIFLKNFTKKTGLNPALAGDRRILILASLVEREAKSDPDRQIIAGIFQKRLDNNWPLQVDASVQYAVSAKSCMATPIDQCDWWQEIFDTRYPSLYNTYLYPGLPPGPICNPGLASIQAVQAPQMSPYWYYLTGSDGVTRYAENLSGHNLNIDKYLKP